MTTRKANRVLGVLTALFLFAMLPSLGYAEGGIAVNYLYNLSDFTGVIPFTWVRVVPDPTRNEVYVCNGSSVHVFNASGMEIYKFGDDERLGSPCDVAVLENGDLLLLSYFPSVSEPALIRCNYRGEFLERRPMTGFPERWGEFRPSRMVLQGGKLYLADYSAMKAAVLDPGGSLRELIDLGETIGMNDRQVADSGLGAFDADDRGNLYFTVPTRFKAYRLSAGRTLGSFGQPGSNPGKFGVANGIAADRSGTIYVVDTLRCVVMAFDREFNFLHEFGYRTSAPGGLVAPKDATVSGEGMIYVTQQAERGVNVYRLSSELSPTNADQTSRRGEVKTEDEEKSGKEARQGETNPNQHGG